MKLAGRPLRCVIESPTSQAFEQVIVLSSKTALARLTTSVILYDVIMGTVVFEYLAHTKPISGMFLLEGKTRLLTWSQQEMILVLWELDVHDNSCNHTILTGHSSPIRGVEIVDGGKMALSFSEGQLLR